MLMSNPLSRKITYKVVSNFAKIELMSGVTTIRTVGGIAHYDSKLRDEILKRKVIGPRIVASNEGISVPHDQIKKLLSKYPKEMTAEETSYQGIVVIEYDSFGKGSKKLWNQFLKNVKDHKDCAIVICQYTVEGDPILQYVSNVNGKFYYVEDSTRDAYGSEKYVQYTYDYYKIYKQDGHYTAILTMDNKLTFDEAQDVRSLKTAIQLLDVKQ